MSTSDDSAKTLSSRPHGVKGEEVALLELIVFLEELQPGLEDTALGVDIGDAKQHHTSAIVVRKVNPL